MRRVVTTEDDTKRVLRRKKQHTRREGTRRRCVLHGSDAATATGTRQSYRTVPVEGAERRLARPKEHRAPSALGMGFRFRAEFEFASSPRIRARKSWALSPKQLGFRAYVKVGASVCAGPRERLSAHLCSEIPPPGRNTLASASAWISTTAIALAVQAGSSVMPKGRAAR